MNLTLIRLLLSIIAILAAGAIAGWSAHKVTQNHYTAVISKMQVGQAKEKAAAEKAAADQLRATQSLSDVLSSNLANAEYAINTLTLEKTREIHHYATGNICFNTDLTRVLNQPFGDYTTQSQTSSTPAAEDAAIASITAEPLTDTDLAEWIANAQGQYETCRGRLSALIDFELQAQ